MPVNLKNRKRKLKEWGAILTTTRVSNDPTKYLAEASVVILGERYRSFGFGETLKEARHVAMWDLSIRVFGSTWVA
jgi:hypothetical protein